MAPERIETVIAEYYTPERICREIGPADEWDGWIVAVEDADVVGAGAGGMTARDRRALRPLPASPPPGRRDRDTVGRDDHRAAADTGRPRAVGQRGAGKRQGAAVLPCARVRGSRDAAGVGHRPGGGTAVAAAHAPARVARRRRPI